MKPYAALLIVDGKSNVKERYLIPGGKQYGVRLMRLDEKPTNIPTSLWGRHGWSTGCYTLDDGIKEVIVSNSRSPTSEVDKQACIHWLIMEMEVPLCKLTYLLIQKLVTIGNALRLHGNIPGSWISALHIAVQWEMTHRTGAERMTDPHPCLPESGKAKLVFSLRGRALDERPEDEIEQ